MSDLKLINNGTIERQLHPMVEGGGDVEMYILAKPGHEVIVTRQTANPKEVEFEGTNLKVGRAKRTYTDSIAKHAFEDIKGKFEKTR